MPKVKCRCGYIFDLTVDSPFEYILIPENDILHLIAEADKTSVDGGRIDDRINANQKQILICPTCGKILMHDGNGRYSVYEKLPPAPNIGENVYGDLDPPSGDVRRSFSEGGSF